jgi:hypothetical protein
MIWRRVVSVCVLLLSPCTTAAAEIDQFFGEWRGVEVSVTGAKQPIELNSGDLDLSITAQGDGFQIHALGLGRESDGSLALRPFEAAFAPTETPGVYAFEPSSGSLLSSLFADPAVGNPLQGDTLLWARHADDTLHVYSLAIDDRGGFILDQSSGQLTDGGMVSRYVLRLENDQIVTIDGRLQRAGD